MFFFLMFECNAIKRKSQDHNACCALSSSTYSTRKFHFKHYKLSNSSLVLHTRVQNTQILGTISVELSEDLVDSCIPGDVVVISGIVKKLRSDERKRRGRTNNRAGLYVLYIDANDVSNTRYTSSNKESVSFTNLDLEMVRKVYHSPSPFELIVSSICPTIFGHELIKFGLALILFGGHGTDSTDESVSVRIVFVLF